MKYHLHSSLHWASLAACTALTASALFVVTAVVRAQAPELSPSPTPHDSTSDIFDAIKKGADKLQKQAKDAGKIGPELKTMEERQAEFLKHQTEVERRLTEVLVAAGRRDSPSGRGRRTSGNGDQDRARCHAACDADTARAPGSSCPGRRAARDRAARHAECAIVPPQGVRLQVGMALRAVPFVCLEAAFDLMKLLEEIRDGSESHPYLWTMPLARQETSLSAKQGVTIFFSFL